MPASARRPTTHAAQASAGPPAAWRKVLYADQETYEDSHTGGRFLEELVVNADVPQRRYWPVVCAALPVSQQLSAVGLLSGTSCHLYQGTIVGGQLLLCDTLVVLTGFLLALLCRWAGRRRSNRATNALASPIPVPPHVPTAWQQPARDSGRVAKASLAALVAATALLTPLLHSLTVSISTDSVVACAAGLLLAHLYLAEYSSGGSIAAGPTASVPEGAFGSLGGSAALACGLGASMLTASRLRSLEDVLAQMLLSIEIYILGPRLRAAVASMGTPATVVLAAALAAAATVLLSRLSILAASAFVCTNIFVTFICPMWLVRIHKYKAQINGPWDEAMPHLLGRG